MQQCKKCMRWEGTRDINRLLLTDEHAERIEVIDNNQSMVHTEIRKMLIV